MLRFVVIALAELAACLLMAGPVTPPNRAHGVPLEAMWAGGPDGGAWILCQAQQHSIERYQCKVYNDQSGNMVASGSYVIRKSTWNRDQNTAVFLPVDTLPKVLRYSSFDGKVIKLDDSIVLLPE